MAMQDEDWKARAQAAESELAERLVRDFEQRMRDIVASKDASRRKIGKMMAALGELIDSPLPTATLARAMEQWTKAMQGASSGGAETTRIEDVVRAATQGEPSDGT